MLYNDFLSWHILFPALKNQLSIICDFKIIWNKITKVFLPFGKLSFISVYITAFEFPSTLNVKNYLNSFLQWDMWPQHLVDEQEGMEIQNISHLKRSFWPLSKIKIYRGTLIFFYVATTQWVHRNLSLHSESVL